MKPIIWHLARNAGKLWLEAPADTKLRVQSCLFPEGVLYGAGVMSNTCKSPIFSDLEAFEAGKEHLRSAPCALVARRGFEPLLPA